ncbi:MAG: ribose 5-phosphate isomerase B [Bacteroidales bacterium]|nr:ribose 5-phosphate isomerase B [Bacteroidales bacterium]
MEKTTKNIAIACDHAGFELKEAVKAFLTKNQYIVKDYGTYSADSVDYPDMVHPLGRDINNGVFERGIVICGTGNGVQMTVNKYPNVRCALCWIPEIAKLARQHNNANILSMPARFIDKDTAIQIVKEYLNTDFEGGRHLRRVEKINQTLK